jgi:hypothetical protein
MSDNKKVIENVLKQGTDNIDFEPIPDTDASPMAEPVVSKNNTSGDVKASQEQAKAETTTEEKKEEPKTEAHQETKFEEPPAPEQTAENEEEDAPEQEINAEQGELQNGENQEQGEFELPLEEATLMANSLLGVINNAIEVGGGYFITIKKHKDFYDFEDLIQVIDNQNVKNIKRLKLDAEDKALLKPLLIKVLRKKSKVLSPDQQLLMVTLSILMKKGKIVLEIRKENEQLVERIRDIIRIEVAKYHSKEDTSSKASASSQNMEKATIEEEEEEEHEHKEADEVETEVMQSQEKETARYTGMPNTILETAD